MIILFFFSTAFSCYQLQFGDERVVVGTHARACVLWGERRGD